ncbi:ATP-dependent helicase [Corynebacterium tapiri]|uniref:DNA 3'-5' helicase n=1 Tax=Corynebacterium tapiri TaxID=1448266 RepID=A0A5C4U5C5_9CORY|nr:UvrD-helicase domain-containing protein [Corynebacterium tapiri]TNL98397.1 ATP-dependent helicase [Corynebacterium tapiri]
MAEISPTILSHIVHGPGRAPTEQQAAVTQAEPGPMLVVAGAGAGKTETMASRVLWLVANGYATPDQVLGLTFTRKAAQELGRRIRGQFQALAASPKIKDLDPSGRLADDLVTLPPTVATYDSYAGNLIREYGLLVPVEPGARLITEGELYTIAHDVVMDYRGTLRTSHSSQTVVAHLLDLVTNLDNDLITLDEALARSQELITTIEDLPKGPKQRGDGLTKDLQAWIATATQRIDMLELVKRFKAELVRRSVVTHNERMSVAARLVRDQPEVAASQRRRFRVVMLDEYQDTSHSQRILLSHLFGTPDGRGVVDESLTVTAVGDPMQAIYRWRGATVENLAQFGEDFPVSAGGEEDIVPAPKRELTTSWRNPSQVLSMANGVSEDVFFPEGRTSQNTRPVAELEPRPGAGNGVVSLGTFETREEEISWVADAMAQEYHRVRDSGEVFTGAVLVRKNKDSAAIAQAFAERDIPHEIVGLGGLLNVPEVADLVALATMLVRPHDDAAALRILTGPLVGLGVADVQALADRVKNLNGIKERTELPLDPQERMNNQLAEAVDQAPESVAGFTDAVADLGERERYSPEAVARLERLGQCLRYLRTHSLSNDVVDIFAEIDKVFGVRTEVMSRPGRNTHAAVHIDAFLDQVESSNVDTLPALLDYLAIAQEHEKGLEQGEVKLKGDRVQILTGHKAKGLEWHAVAVLHADSRTYRAQGETHLTMVHKVPPAQDAEQYGELGDRKEMLDLGKQIKDADRAAAAEENARLFYVAMTRTEQWLSITASEKEAYTPFAKLMDAFPESVVSRFEPADDQQKTPPDPVTGTFPNLPVDENIRAGARLVREAMGDLPAHTSGEMFDILERETTALIQEHEASQSPVVDVELPQELTATDLVAIKRDPLQFARRQRRPVPFKPNLYAKRGTAFHQWLEDRFGAQSLLDDTELPGIDEPAVDAAQLEELKEAFLASEWAQRTPTYVEHPFEVSIGETMVRGRMDAIFQDSDGTWTVVDWKTGHVPTGQQLRSAEIQLAVYAEAWRRIIDSDQPVHAAFYYVGSGTTLAPRNLPSGQDLAHLLQEAAGEFTED